MAVPLAGAAVSRLDGVNWWTILTCWCLSTPYTILWLPLMQLLRLQPCRGLGAPSLIWRWALQLIGQVLSRPLPWLPVQPPQPADLREAPGMLSSMPITLGNDRVLCRRFLRAGVPGRSRTSLCASTMHLCEINRGNLNCPLSLSHRAILAHPTRIHGAISLPGSAPHPLPAAACDIATP